MSRLNYALVPERPSDAPIYRKGWRSIKRPYAKPPAGIGTAAVLATRRGLHEDVKPRSRAHNFEIPAWNIDFPDPARGHREISTDAPKAKSVCGGWRLAFPSLVLESTPGDAAAAATPNDGIPFNTAPFGVQAILSYDPEFCLRKAEKARAQNDPAESVNATPFADSWKVEESRLLVPIRRTIMTANMASSSKVKLEDMSLLKKSGKGTGTRRSSQRYSFRQLMESGRVTLACAHPPHYHDSEHGLILPALSGSQTIPMKSQTLLCLRMTMLISLQSLQVDSVGIEATPNDLSIYPSSTNENFHFAAELPAPLSTLERVNTVNKLEGLAMLQHQHVLLDMRESGPLASGDVSAQACSLKRVRTVNKLEGLAMLAHRKPSSLKRVRTINKSAGLAILERRKALSAEKDSFLSIIIIASGSSWWIIILYLSSLFFLYLGLKLLLAHIESGLVKNYSKT